MTTPQIQPETTSGATPDTMTGTTANTRPRARSGPSRSGLLVGQRLNGFLLEALIGTGGMADVYRARELALDRDVAVKVLPASLATDPDYVQRFRTEARRVAALDHPHIVPIYHFDDAGPLLYLVMPVLKESLRERLERETRLDPDEAIRLICEVASALELAHAAELVHRDVKPENILLDEAGNALLTDFGIARQVTFARQGGAQTLSGTGLPVGTPEYMAPEQLRNAGVDQRADIYALGAVLYELLTGRAPYEADTPYEVAALVLTSPLKPPSARNPQIWPALEQAILRALAFRPRDRYPDAANFAAALREAQKAPRDAAPATGSVASAPRVTRSLGGALADDGDITKVDTLPAITIVRPTVPARVLTSLRRQRLMLASAIALLALTLVGGGTLAKVTGFGFASGVRTIFLPGQVVTATPPPSTTAAALTAIAEGIPGGRATSTPRVPTQNPRSSPPVPFLSVDSIILVANEDHCSGQQRIMNNSGQTLAWQWQQKPPKDPPWPTEFTWSLNESGASNWPPQPQHGALANGNIDTVLVLMRCPPPQSTYNLTLTDSLGHTYPFTMTWP